MAMLRPIIDVELTKSEALKQNPKHLCPEEVIDNLAVVEVKYCSFDKKIHIGQIIIHKDLVHDVEGAFRILFDDKFPIQSVIPISDKKYLWDDDISGINNNTSGFNYRYVRNTTTMSNHAHGRAIDINPNLNPYFPESKTFPVGASYDPSVPGTIVANSRLVQYFKDLGWRWGGDWDEDLDYQHFEKLEV